jgi:hypothetical protein
MTAQTLTAIRRIMRDEGSTVTPVDGVTTTDGYARKTSELRRLRRLRLNGDAGRSRSVEGMERAGRAALAAASSNA